MKTDWTKEFCGYLPPEFEKINSDTWAQRKNIEKRPKGDDGSDGGWQCEVRFISEDLKIQVEMVKEVVGENEDVSELKTGYEAATILFGGNMATNPVIRASELRAVIETSSQYLSDDQAITVPELFPAWENNHSYRIADKVSRGDILYKCVQAHTSQADWVPENTPSLWVRMDNPTVEWPEWVQPLGAQDAYPKDYKVSHNGKHWISNVDSNVWEPGVYGWTEVTQ